MRKLATIRRIAAILPIPNADAIEVAQVDNWKVVVKKGDHRVGELVIYCEVDSWIPHEIAPLLSKGQEPREYEGIKGERLRTVRLRGTTSQGLILPLDILGVIKDIDGVLVATINMSDHQGARAYYDSVQNHQPD